VLIECWTAFGFLAASRGNIKVAMVYDPPFDASSQTINDRIVKLNESDIKTATEKIKEGFKFWVRALSGTKHNVEFPVSEDQVSVSVSGKYFINRTGGIINTDFVSLSQQEWKLLRNSSTAVRNTEMEMGKYPKYHFIFMFTDKIYKVATALINNDMSFFPSRYNPEHSSSKRNGPGENQIVHVPDLMMVNDKDMSTTWQSTEVIAHEIGHMAIISHPKVFDSTKRVPYYWEKNYNWNEVTKDDKFDTIMDYYKDKNMNNPRITPLDRALASDTWDMVSMKVENYTLDTPYVIKNALGLFDPFDNNAWKPFNPPP